MATTTNYGWTTPDDTALVKDGASAIRTLGSSVDTTTKNLNPETTLGDLSFRSSTSNVNTRIPIGSSGQHLTVVAGVPAWSTASDQTPLTTKGDIFTFSTIDARLGVGANGTVLQADSAEATGLKWATPADQTPLTTKGDLFTFSTIDARLGVGTNNHVLTADSAEATGLKWAAPATPSSGLNFISSTTFTAVSSQSFNSVFSATYRNYKLIISIDGSTAAQSGFRLRASGTDNSSSNYGQEFNFSTRSTLSRWDLMRIDNGEGGTAIIDVINPFETYKTNFNNQSVGADDTNVDGNYSMGRLTVSTSYDGFTIFPEGGTFTGRVSIYGYGQ